MDKYNIDYSKEVYYDLLNILKDLVIDNTNLLYLDDINYIKENIHIKVKKLKFYLELEVDSLLNEIEYDCELLKLLSNNLHNEIDKFYANNHFTFEYIKEFIERIKLLLEEFNDSNIDLSPRYKNLLEDENYEILFKYNSFNPIIKTMKSNIIKNFDFTDFKNFFRKSKIIKIINGNKEILLSTLIPNKFLIIGFEECENIEEIENNIQSYKEECCTNDCEYLFGKSNQLLVVYLLDM